MTKPLHKLSLLALAALLFAGCSHTQTTQPTRDTIPTMNATSSQPTYEPPTLSETPIVATQATLVTNKGEITIKLFRDKAPLTTQNFLKLTQKGFYDGIVFHRVIPDFMAQVGDPLTKEAGKEGMWGSGGPGYTIDDEFDPSLRHDKPGMVSMANRGPKTGGSQFFITHVPTPWLDDKHAIFGEVTKGMDVVLAITQGDKIESVRIE